MSTNTLEVVEEQANPLALAVQQFGLEGESLSSCLSRFQPLMSEAKRMIGQVEHLTINETSTVNEKKLVRTARLALREIRCKVENERKSLKEDSVRRGKAIDGMANILKAMIEPVESHLEDQEKFDERREQARKDALRAERGAMIRPYSSPEFYQLADMPEDAFNQLLSTLKAAYEAKLEAQRKEAEQARIEAERKAKEEAERREKERQEAERVRAENDRLRKEAEAREAKTKAEREEAAKKAAEAKKLADAKLAKEKAERERLEAQLRKKEADAKAQAAAEQAHADRLAKAPDAEKLIALAASIEGIEVPALKTKDGIAAHARIKERIRVLVQVIKTEAETL